MGMNLTKLNLEELQQLQSKVERATVALEFSLIPHNNETFLKTNQLLSDIQSELNNRRPDGMNMGFQRAQFQA